MMMYSRHIAMTAVVILWTTAAGFGDPPRTETSPPAAQSQPSPATGETETSAGREAGEPADPQDAAATDVKTAETENYIGVVTAPVPPALARQLAEVLKGGEGLLVVQVLPVSPAARDGIEQYDVLTHYDDQRLLSSEQLKKLVGGDEPERAVALGIIRSGKPAQVTLTLGRRTVIPRQQVLQGRPFRLVQPRARLQVLPKPEGEQPPASQTPEPSTKGRGVTVVMTSSEDGKIHLRVDSVDPDGQAKQWKFEGTRDEILKRLGELPETIRDNVRRNLERTKPGAERGRALRFLLQPQVDGANQGYRILIDRPTANGEQRVLELERQFDPQAQLPVDRLLDLRDLNDELKQLDPAVRSKIEQTLERLHVPEPQRQTLPSQ